MLTEYTSERRERVLREHAAQVAGHAPALIEHRHAGKETHFVYANGVRAVWFTKQGGFVSEWRAV